MRLWTLCCKYFFLLPGTLDQHFVMCDVPLHRHCLSKKQLSGWGDPLLSGVQAQLSTLGNDHVGYSSKQFSDVGISIVGARPFSAVSFYLAVMHKMMLLQRPALCLLQ